MFRATIHYNDHGKMYNISVVKETRKEASKEADRLETSCKEKGQQIIYTAVFREKEIR